MKTCILWCWLALSAWAAAAGGPSTAALGFLEDLKAGEKNAEECLADSLLSIHCGAAKREAIQRRLERLGNGLRRGEVRLEVLEEKLDGDSAGVLVAALGGLNPMDVDVVALGTRKKGGAWKVAPVPGSFENAVDGFDTALEQRLAALADWMGRERVVRMQALHEAGEERLKQRMEEAVPRKLLEDGSPVDVVDGFLTACARRDLPMVLAYVTSGLDERRSEKVREAVATGLEGLDNDPAWGLLTRPGVAGVLLKSDAEREVLALFYDSTGPGSVRRIEFSVGRVAGQWQVLLPSVLRDGPVSIRRSRDWLASGEMQRKFPSNFERRWEVLRLETVAEASTEIDRILRDGRLGDLFRMSCRAEGMKDVEKMVVYAEAARLWGKFRDDADVLKGKLVGTMEEGTAGLVMMHRVSASRITAPELVPVLLTRDGDGWGLAPGVSGRGDWDDLPEERAKDLQKILERFFDEKTEWQKKAAAGFLKDFDEIGSDVALPLTENEARGAVAAFRRDLRQGRMKDTYRRCGLINRSEGALEALNSLRYEPRGVRREGEEDKELLVKVEGTWGAVSMRVVAGLGHEPDYSMYLVRKTKGGLRVMVDGGLRYATNPGRRILNEAVWAHMKAHLEEADIKRVQALSAAHNEISEKDYKLWEKNSK